MLDDHITETTVFKPALAPRSPNDWDELTEKLHSQLVYSHDTLYTPKRAQKGESLNELLPRSNDATNRVIACSSDGKVAENVQSIARLASTWKHIRSKNIAKFTLDPKSEESRRVREWFLDNMGTDKVHLDDPGFTDSVMHAMQNSRLKKITEIIKNLKDQEEQMERDYVNQGDLKRTTLEELYNLRDRGRIARMEELELQSIGRSRTHDSLIDQAGKTMRVKQPGSRLYKNGYAADEMRKGLGCEFALNNYPNDNNESVFASSMLGNIVIGSDVPNQFSQDDENIKGQCNKMLYNRQKAVIHTIDQTSKSINEAKSRKPKIKKSSDFHKLCR
ncbi:hypothetical protein GJ496_005009 [Pomphorhynchus laevis]|nr:hypothetical protein GJ496_005009 [Pomphorhynchus laevis]